LKKGNVVQVSEKIYKAAEEAVKIFAKEHTPEVYDKAEHNGRWLASLLREAVRKIEGAPGDDVGRAWDAAWVLSYMSRAFTKGGARKTLSGSLSMSKSS